MSEGDQMQLPVEPVRDCPTCRHSVQSMVMCTSPKEQDPGFWSDPLVPCPGWELKP